MLSFLFSASLANTVKIRQTNWVPPPRKSSYARKHDGFVRLTRPKTKWSQMATYWQETTHVFLSLEELQNEVYSPKQRESFIWPCYYCRTDDGWKISQLWLASTNQVSTSFHPSLTGQRGELGRKFYYDHNLFSLFPWSDFWFIDKGCTSPVCKLLLNNKVLLN